MTRSEEILKLIVEHFIRTGEPVGSKTLLETYHLGVSSATIRAEMSQMEKEGLLEKPHASAGRVPSSKGYEYYVEHLREERIDSSVKYAIQTVLEKKAQSVEEVISRVEGIRCGFKPTSCPDQLAQALKQFRDAPQD